MTPEVKERIEQIRHGNVPKGYKKGKYGVLPHEWSEETLSNLSDNITKGATPTTYGHTWVDEGVLFLRSDCVSEDGFVNREPVFISEKAHRMMSRSVVRAGDILISITGYLGKVGLVPACIQEANINQHIARVRPHEDRCNPAFVYYYLGTDPLKCWFDLIQTGQAYPQLSLEQIRQIKMPVPSITEQQKIAEVLGAQDTFIKLKEKLLEEKQRQKKCLMQQLLTGKKRLPGFVGEWKKVAISSFIHERDEKTTENNQYDILSVTKNGIVRQSEHFNKQIASEDNTGYKVLRRGNLAFSSMNLWMGSLDVLEDYEIGIISPAYKVFSFDSSLMDISFGKQFMRSEPMIWQYKANSEQGASIVRRNLDLNALLSTKVRIPNLDEQRAIALVFVTADKEIELLRQTIEQEKQKKKALIQLLLTGIVRTC